MTSDTARNHLRTRRPYRSRFLLVFPIPAFVTPKTWGDKQNVINVFELIRPHKTFSLQETFPKEYPLSACGFSFLQQQTV